METSSSSRLGEEKDMELSLASIRALAPDESSFSAASKLANAKHWQQSALHTLPDGQLLSGLCAGSGAKPYQTSVDLRGPRFKCSCPSRKFPCKHALALLLLHQQSAFAEQEVPDWVQAWLEKHEQTQAKKAEKVSARASNPSVKSAAPSAKRLQNAEAGIERLQLWLEDVLRNGLMQFDGSQAREMAKRMHDAQLPALAMRLQRLYDITFDDNLSEPAQVATWQWQMLTELYSWCLLFQRREALSPLWQAEVYAQLGFVVRQEQVLAGEGVEDVWHCIGITITEEDNHLKRTNYWLFGAQTKRFATWIVYSTLRTDEAPRALLLGACYHGKLYFYEGVHSLRALPADWQASPTSTPWTGFDLKTAWEQIQSALVENPFLQTLPLLVRDVELVQQGEQWFLCDEAWMLPLKLTWQERAQLLAQGANKRFSVAFLYQPLTETTTLLSIL